MVYFIATPIGNLKDVTYRAIETLQNCDIIFCEDTRHSLKFLTAYGIKKPLKSCHKFNEKKAAEDIIAEAEKGGEVGIISDAGMPVISDPGNVVAKELKKANIPYTVVPGANAFLSALILSAFPSERFAFLGFLPEKKGEKKEFLQRYKDTDLTLCFHVAPQDMAGDIAEMYSVFGNRKACAVREITKLHEETVYFELKDGYDGETRGEFVVIVEGAKEMQNPLCSLSEAEHIRHYLNAGYDKKEAIKLAAKDRGISKSEIYKFSIDL